MKTGKQKERELIIKLHNEGRPTREIASILDISKSKAAFWVTRHKRTGSINDMPRTGRPTPLTKEKLGLIAQAIKSRITEARGKAGVTSKEVLALIDAKIQKKYSLRHAERILHKVGFSLITPRVSHIRKDEKAQAKFRDEFKKKSNRNIWGIQ